MKLLAAMLVALSLSGCIVVPVHDGPAYRSYGYHDHPYRGRGTAYGHSR